MGIGIDCVFDLEELEVFLEKHPEMFPPELGYSADLVIMPPERMPEIAEVLLKKGYGEADLRKIMGGNLADLMGVAA